MKLKFRAEPKDVIIFCMFAVFLLYLVAIAILNLHSLTVESRFWGLNPFPAFLPEYLAATLVFYLLALVGLCMTASSYFFDREKGFGYEAGKKSEDGYSKFSSAAEMKKKPDIKRITLSDDEYNYAGIPIMLNLKEAYVDDGENHSLVIGGTGSGKTQCVMLPMSRILAKAGESMIFTDPKGELYKDLGGLLKERGYNIIVLNFRDPLRGNCWNPFSLPYKFYKEGKDDKAKELIEDLASNILADPEAAKSDPFWSDTATSYFSGLAMGLFEDAPEEYVNINSINQMATTGEENIGRMTYLQAYFKEKGEESTAYISAAATINAPNETKGGIVSTFKTKIRIFSSREALSEMMSKTDFDFTEIGKKKTAVFLIIQDEKKTYHSLLTIFLKQIYESLVDVASSQPDLKLPIRTNFMLDEFANMPPLKDVDAMISASRSRNMRFNFIIQNYSQLNQQYGQDMAETIKGNCGNIHFLTTTELKALEEISKLAGEKKGKEKKDKPSEPDKPLLSVSDLQKLNKFQFIILRLRCHPFKVQFEPDFKINKINGWGAIYDPAELPHREANSLKIFDIKKFVEDKRKQKIMEGLDEDSTGDNKKTPMPPFMMGQGTRSQGAKPNNLDMDQFLKNIDKTIAKLEEEEKQEKERLSHERKEKQEKSKQEIKLPTVEEIKSDKPKLEPKIEVNTPLEEKVEFIEPKVIQQKPIEEKPVIKEEKEVVQKGHDLENQISNESEKEQQGKEIEKLINEISQRKETEPKVQVEEKLIKPVVESTPVEPQSTRPEIEKPKINVDVDSIIVDDNITDDQFFDDFFDDDDDDEK